MIQCKKISENNFQLVSYDKKRYDENNVCTTEVF